MLLLQEKIADIINDAERVVARYYGVTQNGITHVRVLHAPIYRRQTIRISKTAIAPSKDRSSENESN